jgi:predicted nucleic acid-binding protein
MWKRKFAGCAAMVEMAPAARAYIDTNVFIYFMEFDDVHNRAAREWISAFQNNGTEIVTSRLTFLECIYGPAKVDNRALVDLYRAMLVESAAVRLVEIAHDILESAAFQGGRLGLKLPDAIHYFTALHAGCDLFLSDDRQFKPSRSMRVASLVP